MFVSDSTSNRFVSFFLVLGHVIVTQGKQFLFFLFFLVISVSLFLIWDLANIKRLSPGYSLEDGHTKALPLFLMAPLILFL